MEESPFDQFSYGQPETSDYNQDGVGSSCSLPDGSEGVIDYDGNCVPVEGYETPQMQAPPEDDDWWYDQIMAGPEGDSFEYAPEALAGAGLGVGAQRVANLYQARGYNPGLGVGSTRVSNLATARGTAVPVGGPRVTSTIPRLVGPSTPPQYTGSSMGRPVPGTQLSAPRQLPSLSGMAKPATIAGQFIPKASRLAKLSPWSLAYALADTATEGLTGRGISERVGEGVGGTIADWLYGDTSQSAMSEDELAAIQSPEMETPGYQGGEMFRLGDEPLNFNQYSGPSSSPSRSSDASMVSPWDSSYAKWLPEEKEPTSFLESLKGLEGEEGSPQRGYYDYIAGGGEMTPEKIAEAEAYAASMGTTFDPATGYSRQAYEDYEKEQAPLRSTNELIGFDPAYEGQSLSDWMAYRDDEAYQTRQVLDPQGRFRRESSIPGLTPEERRYVTDQVVPGQAAYDNGSYGGRSVLDDAEEDDMPSLGHFRNLARAKGFKGNRNMPAAKQLMQEERDRRQKFSLDARREQRLGRPKRLTPEQQREADLRLEKLTLEIENLRKSGELTPYEIEANKLDLESKKLRNEKTQAEVNALLSKKGVEPQDWTPREMGEFLKIVKDLRVGFNKDGELTDFEGLDSDLTPDSPKYKLLAGSAIGRAWAGIEEEPSVEATQPKTGAPRSGEVRSGFRFKGGNPNDKSNWEKV